MENQWQPIQTAPKDGSNFLMFITGIEYRKNNDDKKYKAKTIKAILIAMYRSTSNEFVGRSVDLPLYSVYIDELNYKDKHDLTFDNRYIKYDIQATHWMPLPKPPIINN